MTNLDHLLENNRNWAQRVLRADPLFHARLAGGQQPGLLWIGCSDSRVPPNLVLDLGPGQLFVHRNVANQVLPRDLNVYAAVQFAVETLQVRDIIVCGHYDCGGIKACLPGAPTAHLGDIDNWLRRIVDLRNKHRAFLSSLPDDTARANRLSELNAIQQLLNLARLAPVQHAWSSGFDLTLHTWIYDIAAGHVHNLNASVSTPEQLMPIYQSILARLTQPI